MRLQPYLVCRPVGPGLARPALRGSLSRTHPPTLRVWPLRFARFRRSTDSLADPRLADGSHALVVAAARVVARARARRDQGGPRSGRSRRGHARRAGGRCAAVAAPRAQRERRSDPHESRARTARAGGARSRRRGGRGLLEPRVRPRSGCPRLAPGPPHRVAARDHRWGGVTRRQQQRRRRDARARRARRGPRGARLTRRADRDRRRLPDPRRAGALGRPTRRGGDDEPHARGRLRACDRAEHGADSSRPPGELPCRGLHRATRARRARCDREEGGPPARRRSRLGRAHGNRRRVDGRREPLPPAPTSSASPATSSSAAHRRESSSAAQI